MVYRVQIDTYYLKCHTVCVGLHSGAAFVDVRLDVVSLMMMMSFHFCF